MKNLFEVMIDLLQGSEEFLVAKKPKVMEAKWVDTRWRGWLAGAVRIWGHEDIVQI